MDCQSDEDLVGLGSLFIRGPGVPGFANPSVAMRRAVQSFEEGGEDRDMWYAFGDFDVGFLFLVAQIQHGKKSIVGKKRSQSSLPGFG